MNRTAKRLKKDPEASACFTCSKTAPNPDASGTSNEDNVTSIHPTGGWEFRRLKTKNYCYKLSLVRSAGGRDLPEGKWVLDLDDPGVILAIGDDLGGNCKLVFEKSASVGTCEEDDDDDDDDASPSDFVGKELELDGLDWHVKHLEVTGSEVRLELYKTTSAFKFGRETWDFCNQDPSISVTMALAPDCGKHGVDRPLIVKRAPPPCDFQRCFISDELLLNVFEFIPMYELPALGCVNGRWDSLAKDEKLWKKKVLTIKNGQVEAAKGLIRFGKGPFKEIQFVGPAAPQADDELLMLIGDHCSELEKLVIRPDGICDNLDTPWRMGAGWKRLFQRSQKLSVLSVRDMGLDSHTLLEVVAGSLNQLTELGMITRYQRDKALEKLEQALQGKPFLRSVRMLLINSKQLDVIVRMCSSSLREITTISVGHAVGPDHPLFKLPLEVLHINHLCPHLISAMRGFSGTLRNLEFEISYCYSLDQVKASILALKHMFHGNVFHALQHLSLTLLSARGLTELIPFLHAFRLILTGIPAMETLSITVTGAGPFPSVAEIFRLLGAHCPRLRRLYLKASRFEEGGDGYAHLFQDGNFLPNLKHVAVTGIGVSGRDLEGDGALLQIRPHLKVSLYRS